MPSETPHFKVPFDIVGDLVVPNPNNLIPVSDQIGEYAPGGSFATLAYADSPVLFNRSSFVLKGFSGPTYFNAQPGGFSPVVPGQTYTASFYVRPAEGAEIMRDIRMYMYHAEDQAGTGIGLDGPLATSMEIEGEWVRIVSQYIPAVSKDFAAILLYVPDVTFGEEHFFTGIKIESGHEATDWALPSAGGAADSVDQDSDEEIVQCVAAVVATPLGTRLIRPTYGFPDQAFRQLGVDIAVLQRAISEWEPRATTLTQQQIEDTVADVQVNVRSTNND